MTVTIKAITAMDEGRVIGRENGLPWHIPEDMKYFVEQTRGHAVLMGRKTYESFPDPVRPLPKRKNIVCTRSPENVPRHELVETTGDPCAYIEAVRNGEVTLDTDTLWVLGGAEIYKMTLPLWDELYLTAVDGKHEGDAYFPEFEDEFELVDRDQREGFAFLRYRRKGALS